MFEARSTGHAAGLRNPPQVERTRRFEAPRMVLALHSVQAAAISLASGTGGLLALLLAAAGLSWSA
jgi:hypothetical protein